MKKCYVMGIETTLRSGVLTVDGRVLHDVSVQWSKPHNSLSELMEASSEFLKQFTLADNQRIVIETREVQE